MLWQSGKVAEILQKYEKLTAKREDTLHPLGLSKSNLAQQEVKGCRSHHFDMFAGSWKHDPAAPVSICYFIYHSNIHFFPLGCQRVMFSRKYEHIWAQDYDIMLQTSAAFCVISLYIVSLTTGTDRLLLVLDAKLLLLWQTDNSANTSVNRFSLVMIHFICTITSVASAQMLILHYDCLCPFVVCLIWFFFMIFLLSDIFTYLICCVCTYATE